MTAWRNSGLAAVLVVMTAGVAAQGQSEPTAPPSASAAPQPLASDQEPPTPSSTTPSEFKPGILGKSTRSQVITNDLGIVDGAPVGTLGDANGGLGQDMWANAPRSDIEQLLGRIPLVSADPFVRSLARRVVLTVSEAPVGPAQRALVTIRIEKLLQAGMIDDAGAIAALLQLNGDADYARVQADALLYSARDAEVCSERTATRLTSDETFWLQLRTWCFAVAGDDAAAELSHAVSDAQGTTDKALDTLLTDALTGKRTAPEDIARPTALHIYLLHKIGLPITSALAAKLGTAANVLAARDARNSAADRLAAATRISQTGALAPDEFVAIMNAQVILAAQLAQARELAAGLPFLPAQSLLRRAASLETRPPAKVALLAAALSAGGHPDRLTLTALLNGDLATAIGPGSATADERSLIARALVLSGRVDSATAWYSGAANDNRAQVFRLLLAIAAPTAERQAAAQEAVSRLASNAAPEQIPTPLAALALGLSDVLGMPMLPDAKVLAGTLEGTQWESTARRPSPADLDKLAETAAQPGRKGEVALRVLEIVGANGPFGLPADVTVECVRVLQQSGLGEDARRLAIEALATAPQ